ncbi:MAG: MaoC family dehydratase [Alphaproteobacteria bacterium]|nr:MaoC family dehydratase [Alphaproteobacteria bacterium]
MPDIYFEDLAAGQEYDLGSRTLDRAAIVDFATEFDPQPFHVDEEAAEQSIYGGLIASGWQTCGVYMRLLCDSFLLQVHSMGSPGVDELRWLGPVRPGDTLSAKLRIDEVRVSKSKPDRGIIMTADEVRNQEGDLVLTLKSPLMVRRRQ